MRGENDKVVDSKSNMDTNTNTNSNNINTDHNTILF